MILPSIGARTTSNAAPNSTVVITLDAAEPGSRVDLVDDVWRLIFYILAGDCKDLGRSMLVNRRFYSLIAYDVVLWRLTYNLTVSGSVFASQKPSLLSPTWIKHEQDPFGHSPTLNEHAVKEMRNPQQLEDQSGSALGSRSPSSQTLDMNDGGWSGSTMLMNSVEPRRCRHTSTAAQSDRRGSVTLMAPGLQLPSPLVLPHHRRIVQSIGTTSTSASHLNTNDVDSSTEVLTKPGHSVNSSTFPTTGSPFSSPDSSSSPAIFSPSSSVSHNGAAQTPASTPSTPSFQLRLPPLVSQVISSSTTPLSAIQHHIPTTTLMHHHPAVYWKYQVVEWLEQEKLRCLRLGLFWGLNAAASRTHGRNKAL
ncbi:hypothetical protein EDD11_009668 [Mortierella claussenii]|nr:hypothetical protein EDD11_009668 [Mortierella claussenii]